MKIMLRTGTLFSFLFCIFSARGYSQTIFFDKIFNDSAIKLVTNQKNIYLVTTSGIYHVKKNTLKSIYHSTAGIRDGVIDGNVIYLATADGITAINIESSQAARLLPETIAYSTDHVAIDHFKNLWFSAKFKGAFLVSNNQTITPIVQTQAVYDVACTPDGFTWIGTNTGLYRIDSSMSVIRYAEEGMEGYELPDNIVEEIFEDEKSNVWVRLPDNLSFIPSASFKGEIAGYDHIGSKNNNVLSIQHLSAGDNTYLFATTEGLIYTKGESSPTARIAPKEIFELREQPAYLLTDLIVRKPKELYGQMVYALFEFDRRLYFICARGIWSVPLRKINRVM